MQYTGINMINNPPHDQYAMGYGYSTGCDQRNTFTGTGNLEVNMKRALNILAVFMTSCFWMTAHADSNSDQVWAVNFVAASERIDVAKDNGYPMARAENLLMKVPQLRAEGEVAVANKYLSTASGMADWYLDSDPSPFFE